METIEDYLNVDNTVPGQQFCCISFISPESIIKKKEIFILHNFLKHISSEYNISEENIINKFEDYKYMNEKTLSQTFTEENDFVCNTRGVKVRGSYDTKQEAEFRAKILQKKDPNHSVFIGQVGYWLPWDPSLTYVDDIDGEYLNNELNTLMKKYKENQESKDVQFNDLVSEKMSIKQQNDNSDPWLDKIEETTNEKHTLEELAPEESATEESATEESVTEESATEKSVQI
jgi:hypothetical protein